jgi:hypothetical protein
MDERSIEHQGEIGRPLVPPLSRRAFLAGAATCAAVGPGLLHAAIRDLGRQMLLHVTTRESPTGYVHTFALTSGSCTLLGSTAVDSLAALAVHPELPVLYVARDCREWESLPSNAVSTRCGFSHRRLWRSPQPARDRLLCLPAAGTCSLQPPRVERGMPLLSILPACRLPSQSLARKPEPCWTRTPCRCQHRTGWPFRPIVPSR